MRDEDKTKEQLISDLVEMRNRVTELEASETGRKRAEDGLLESEAKYSALVEQAMDGVIIVQDEVFKFANRAMAEISGYGLEEIIGMYFLDMVAPESRDLIAERYKLRMAGKKVPPIYEAKMQRKDGIIKDVELSAGIIQYQGRPANMSIVRDITERKKLQEEHLKTSNLESIGTLAGGIAHDFNNVLTAILGNITLAKMYTKPGDRAFERLQEAEKASLRAKDLTQQLLTFSRGGAPVRKVASISELIKDSANFVLMGSNVGCEFSIPDDLYRVSIDEVQIGQVINNLIINADQAMPESGIVRVSACNTTIGKEDPLPITDGNYIKITIEDRGTGIKEEHLPKIFDPYFTTKQKGSGLGLTSAYSIIRNHDGYITLESKLGVGTSFFIYLPATKKEILKKKEVKDIPLTGKGKILLMDDEGTLREIAGEILNYIGYRVELAKGGTEAVNRYLKAKETGEPFDAVILNLTVPGGMGGKETVIKLLEIDPKVKAIVSSGYSNDPVMADYRRYGFSGVISKPYKIKELSDLLHKVITGIVE